LEDFFHLGIFLGTGFPIWSLKFFLKIPFYTLFGIGILVFFFKTLKRKFISKGFQKDWFLNEPFRKKHFPFQISGVELGGMGVAGFKTQILFCFPYFFFGIGFRKTLKDFGVLNPKVGFNFLDKGRKVFE